MPYRHLKADPLGVPRNPLAIYLLLLALVSGVATLSGSAPSLAISKTLSELGARTWGAVLVGGSLSTLVGMFWQGKVTTGLLLKRLGMFVLALASALLAVVMVVGFGYGGLVSAFTYLGFSVACGVQYHNLNERVRAIIAMTRDPLLLPPVYGLQDKGEDQ